MAIENVIVTQETANITVTQAPPTNVTVTPPDVINIELATEGLQGAVGPTPDLQIGTVDTGAAGSMADATITGTITEPLLNLIIPRGDKGETGDVGPTGPANTLTISGVTQLAPSDSPTVEVSGISPNQALAFGIPAGARILNGTAAPASGTGLQGDWFLNTVTSDLYEKTSPTVWTLRTNIKGLTGDTGQTGATGPANQLSVDSVTASAPGSAPSVTIGGAAPAQTISFVLPRGDTGPTGPAPNLTIGTVTTVTPGGTATADVTGTNPNYVINLGIPRGDKGEIGAQWITGADAPTSGIGVEGDFYLVTGVTGTGDVYKKTDATTWTLQGNIRGQAGSGNVNSVNAILPDVNGDVTLTWNDFTGTIPASALPSMATTETYTVASEAAMLALSAQRGDLALRTDLDETFILAGDDPTILANWTALLTDGGNVRLTGDQTIGGIKTFSSSPVVPDASWTIAKTSGLQAALDLKAPLASPTFTGTVSGITAAMVGLGNVVNLAQVDLVNAQTIGGVKTFSDAPVVPDASFTIAKTNGLQGALDGKAATAHTHDTADVTTGTFAIARIPTGTTGTTVALGNHLHTGVYEPVIAAGTTAQYRRGDNTWRDLGSDAVLLTGDQTIAGTKTFSGSVTTTGNRGLTVTHTANLADGVALVNTNPASNISPRLFFQNDTGANGLLRSATSLLITTGATPGSASGTARITLADTGDVTFSNSVDINGNLAIGAGSLTTAQLSNTATNPTALVTGLGVNTANGLLWRASGAGWATNLSNGSTSASAHGLLVGTASADAATGIFQLDSGATNKFKIMGDGYMEHLAEVTLGTTAGNYAISRKYRHGGGTNNYQLMDIMYRRAAGTDWLTADLYQGIGIDSSYLSPTTMKSYIRRSPSTASNSAIGFGSDGTEWLTLNGNASYFTLPMIVSSDYIQVSKASTGSVYLKVGNTSTGNAGLVIDGKNGDFVGTDYSLIVQENAGELTIRNYGGDTKIYYLSNSTPTATFGNGTLLVSNAITAGGFISTGVISTQEPIIDWNGVSTSSQWQKSVTNIAEWTSTSGVEAGELVIDTELPVTNNTMILLHVKGQVHASSDAIIDLWIRCYLTASTVNTIQTLNNGTHPIDFVKFYTKTAGSTLSIGIDSPNADWDWAKVWVDGYFGHSALVADTALDGWTTSIIATPTSSGYTQITSVSPASSVHTDNAQTISGAKTFSSLITGTAGVSTGGVLTVPGTSYQTFGASGVAAPTFTTRSAGTKVVLYEGVTASAVDYALGINSSTLWSSVPTSTSRFEWYAGTTNIATLTGAGNLSTTGTITSTGQGTFSGGINNTPWFEIGSQTGASTPYIDFHAGATFVDYDARIIATSGNGTVGGGTLNIESGYTKFTGTTELKVLRETVAAALGSTGTLTMNLSTSSIFYTPALTGNITLAFSNPPATGIAQTVTLFVNMGSTLRTITYPASVKWVGGAAPTGAVNKNTVYTFVTVDAGATWFTTAAVEQ